MCQESLTNYLVNEVNVPYEDIKEFILYGEIIKKRIKKIREENSCTQEQLAEFLDVSNAYISKIERGKTTINLKTLSSICDYLKLSPSYVLTGCVSSSEDYLRNEITDMLKECPPEKIRLIVEVIKPIIDYKEK